MKLYTRRGDLGKTDLLGGQRVSKMDIRITACGTIDELNCLLGVAVADCKHIELKRQLLRIQHELFNLGADLAMPHEAGDVIWRVGQVHVDRLEQEIDDATAQVPQLKCFILPGGSELAARLHLGRAVCRRAERFAVEAAEHCDVNPMVITYLNRLSDLLFAFARWSNVLEGVEDVPWDHGL
ncbi:MAG: cob(I)yrinic acid a,c-diamide adenosyltransferase [Phycisphaeraceae bacterium JB051]